MNISPEQLREALLCVLDMNRTRFGFDVKALQFRLRMYDLRAQEKEIVDAMEYLAGLPKPFVEETRLEINRANRTWKITDAGMRFADEHRL